MFGATHEKPLTVGTPVARLAILVFSRIFLNTLTSALRAVHWVMSSSSLFAVFLTAFEREDMIAMGRKLCGITFGSFPKHINMC